MTSCNKDGCDWCDIICLLHWLLWHVRCDVSFASYSTRSSNHRTVTVLTWLIRLSVGDVSVRRAACPRVTVCIVCAEVHLRLPVLRWVLLHGATLVHSANVWISIFYLWQVVVCHIIVGFACRSSLRFSPWCSLPLFMPINPIKAFLDPGSDIRNA